MSFLEKSTWPQDLLLQCTPQTGPPLTLPNPSEENKTNIFIPSSELSQGVKVAQSCLTLCDPMDQTVPEILQARILEWVTFPFSKGYSQPRDWTQVSHIAGRFFTSWATRGAQEYWSSSLSLLQQTLPTQELNQGLLYCRQILYQLSYEGNPDKNSIKFLIGDWAYRNKSVIIWPNEKWLLTWSINKIKHLWHMKHHTRCWSPAYSMTTGTLKSNRYKLLTGNYKRNESNKVQMQIHRSVLQKNRKTSLLRCQRNLCRSQTKVFITYSIQKLNLQIQAFWARKTKWPVCPMNEWVKG